MFSFFRKKSQVETLIAADGVQRTADRFAEIVARKLTERRVAYEFIFQELDGAHQGSAASRQFARSSGIDQAEYLGALSRSVPDVDGPGGPQQLLLSLCLQITDREPMSEFRCRVDDKIMRILKLGRYADEDRRDAPALNSGSSHEIGVALIRKQEEIADAICDAANRGGSAIVDQNGAVLIVGEALEKLTEEQIVACRTEVACLFALAHVADSAYRDGDEALARYIFKQCEPVASRIFQVPNDQYMDLEITMVDSAMKIMKRIDGHL